MEYKSVRLVGLFSLFMGAVSVLGAAALTFGPWAEPSAQMTRTFLLVSSVAFSMVGAVANNVVAILERQADQIAALQRQLADQQFSA